MWMTLKEFYFLVLHELKFKKKTLMMTVKASFEDNKLIGYKVYSQTYQHCLFLWQHKDSCGKWILVWS